MRDLLAARVDGPIVLGIRPEHLSIRAAADTSPLELNVDVIEPLGRDMDLSARTPLGTPMVARLEATGGLAPGTQVTLHANSSRAHFFEPGEIGRNLSISRTDT
jgi:multiple sugar transport system ATP-binding protein